MPWWTNWEKDLDTGIASLLIFLILSMTSDTRGCTLMLNGVAVIPWVSVHSCGVFLDLGLLLEVQEASMECILPNSAGTPATILPR